MTRAAKLLFEQLLLARARPTIPDDLTALNQLPMVTLTAKVEHEGKRGKRVLTVTLHNPTKASR
jgi:hypothetical protein